jgi:ferrous iron transporter FeoB
VIAYFLQEHSEAIINIVDASQLERNLLLTVQLLEMNKPLLIALNMMDVAAKRGIHIHIEKLQRLLGVEIQPLIARTGKGCRRLIEKIANVPKKQVSFRLDYGEEIEAGIQNILSLIGREKVDDLPARWLAIQFFDENQTVWSHLEKFIDRDRLLSIFRETEKLLGQKRGHKTTPSEVIFSARDRFIKETVDRSVTMEKENDRTLTEKIDRIVTHQYLGVPIFLALLYFMFMMTFNWAGTPLSDQLDALLSGPVTEWLGRGLRFFGVSDFLMRLILGGIVPGVGGVLIFFPQIFLLFFFISILEDSGYMARVSLMTDKMMECFGLNGKSFIPMIIGFGCNVPGIMAARTIEQPKERLMTILLSPFISCSARLPVYALFVGAFFPKYQALVVLSLYVLGIVVALFSAKVLSKTIFRNESSVFVVELPPYRIPHLQTLMRSTWDKGKGFIKKAGTYIFGGTVLIWILVNMGPDGLFVPMDKSFLARMGGLAAPFLAPLGFGTWQAASALMSGFFAKESVVASLNIFYHTKAESSLQNVLAGVFSPVSAYSFLVFLLLYVPCLPTVATIKKETGSAKWTAFSILYPLLVAYTLSFLIYRAGTLLGR